MAKGWTGEDAAQDQIDATVQDGVERARRRLAGGPSLSHCEHCGSAIPEARRHALPGVRLCVPCQEQEDRAERERSLTSGVNRRGSKDSQLR